MTAFTIITSQYVQIDQTPASIGERILARIIDTLLFVIYYMAMSFILYWFFFRVLNDSFSEDVIITVYFVFLLPVLFYSPLWEFFNRGQSPGKKILGIRVVMKDGSVPGMSAYLLRWLLLLIDLYLFNCIGIISIALTKDRQRLGDLAAHTLVIKEKDYRRVHVTLDEFNHFNADYRPFFPQAENLSLEQVNFINRTLLHYDAQRPQRIHDLAAKVREFLKINPSISDENLLQALVRDFQYYALEEI
ncbi:MAG: RDD family protein [Tannerella sp.]|jgi:uncharacterized RDD family membrane protein YckC|nr:RDD family protein [Tannerella sp.]